MVTSSSGLFSIKPIKIFYSLLTNSPDLSVKWLVEDYSLVLFATDNYSKKSITVKMINQDLPIPPMVQSFERYICIELDCEYLELIFWKYLRLKSDIQVDVKNKNVCFSNSDKSKIVEIEKFKILNMNNDDISNITK